MHSQNFKNGKHKFPVSTESLELLQQQIYMTARLASLAGTNVIVKQPTSSSVPSVSTQFLTFDNQFSPFSGLVIINGQLYPLYGNSTKSRIAVYDSSESVQVPGETDPLHVRTFRYAQYVDSGGLAVNSFTTLDNIVALMSRISTIEGAYMSETDIRALVTSTQNTLQAAITTTNNNLNTTNSNLNTAIAQHNLLANRVTNIENTYKTAAQIDALLAANAQHHMPKGSIIDWYGTCRAASVPYGFVPCGMFGCDLTSDSQRESELAAWRAIYGNAISIQRTGTNGAYLIISQCFGQTVPNLSDKFIVQAGYSYSLGATGGANTVRLKFKEMPKHRHGNAATSNGSASGTSSDYTNNYSSWAGGSDDNRYGTNGHSGGTIDQRGDEATNAGTAHENRPPYYALYKLIKVI